MHLYAAPLQGYTEAIYRNAHAEIYGNGPDRWYTPFIRVEHGEPRGRDMRQLASPLNANHRLVPQIMFRDADEWEKLVTAITETTDYREIDMNLGCPFPPQVRKGRGAGLLGRPDELARIAELMKGHPDVTFSVKMRLGINAPDQWKAVMPAINSMPLAHVTIHPRVAAQQYGGELYLDDFREIMAKTAHPVIYNGDIATPADIDRVTSQFPTLAGIMTGRGLLARPSLVDEWRQSREWTPDERLDAHMRLHSRVAGQCEQTYQGETQILAKLKPFWDYILPSLDRRTAKAIKKAATLPAYYRAIESVGAE